jgi:hypothetical protein
MEQNIHTSFIPKKSLSTVSQRERKSDNIGIIFMLTLIIFIGAIAIAISAFLYQQFLLQSIEKKKASLELAQGRFEPALIEKMSRLDIRMQSAENILSKHKAVSSFFQLLEENTLVSIQFENLSYKTDETTSRVSVSMKGTASNFNSVALQSDIFGKNKFIQESIFSNLNLDNKGSVIFDFTAFIDPRLISYENTLSSQ